MSSNSQENQFKIETGIGPMTDNLLNCILDRLSNDNFKEKLTNKIVDPVTFMINRKIKPYINLSVGLYGLVIVLLCVIIYLLVKKK